MGIATGVWEKIFYSSLLLFYYTLRLRQSIRFLSKTHNMCLRCCLVLVNSLFGFAGFLSGTIVTLFAPLI